MSILRRSKIVKWLKFRFRQAGDMCWTSLPRVREFLKSRLSTLQTETVDQQEGSALNSGTTWLKTKL